MSATASELRERVLDAVHLPGLLSGGALLVVAIAVGSPMLGAIGLAVSAGFDAATANERGAWRGRLQRIGLGVAQRSSVRALLVLGVVASAGTSPGTALTFLVATVAAVVSSLVWQWALEKVVVAVPAMGVHNLGGEGSLTRLVDRTRRRRTLGSNLLIAAELPIGIAFLATAGDELSDIAGRAALLATTLVVVAAAGAAWWWSTRFRRSELVERHLEALREDLERYGASVILYFSGAGDTTYQLNQWVPVFDRLTVPVLVVVRERGHVDRMVPNDLPVLYCRRTRDVEEALTSSARAAFYVANAGRNIHLQRFPHLKHVFLNHGDSDKASSANPVVRVFDLLFVAGALAIERYAQAGVHLPRDRFRIIGRPQLDGLLDRRRKLDGEPTTLLYAPTWEGFFEEADYSSVERMGLELVREVLQHRPDVRIVFKPHPMTGKVRPEARSAVGAITQLLREVGPPHVVAVDHPELDLFAWFDRADVLLSDVSAVVTDWLATDKPYLITNPRSWPLEEFHAQFPSHTAAYVVDGTLSDVRVCLDAALGDDPLATARATMKVRVLGEHDAGPLETFDRAVREVIGQA